MKVMRTKKQSRAHLYCAVHPSQLRFTSCEKCWIGAEMDLLKQRKVFHAEWMVGRKLSGAPR